VRIDDKDERILLALTRNARLSVVHLARIVGLSRSATQERLHRLERDGVIAGYTVLLRARNNQPRVRAWVVVRHGQKGACVRTVRAIDGIPEVRSALSVAGEIDLMLDVDAADLADLERVRSRIEGIPGVESVRTHVVLTNHFENRIHEGLASPEERLGPSGALSEC
jgi:Lrp/AsnC family leucine-responsive transcriptional regulator